MKNKRTANDNLDEFDLTLRGHPPFQPLNRAQRVYLSAIQTSDMVIGVGPAGVGKTFVASAYAIEQLASNRISSIILTRPTVSEPGEAIGFLPGTLEKKLEPWTAPIFDVFYERIGVQKTQTLFKEQKIRIVPFTFMRGRTFKDAIVLVDEAQNMTVSQAKKLVTRAGEGAKYVISGDREQSDLPGVNGFTHLIDMVKDYNLPVPIVEFDSSEVIRSPLCALWVQAFEQEAVRHVA